jgi:hypothetical protein
MLGDQLRPGIVVSIATSGDVLQSSLRRDYKQWHPHAHVFSTDGAFSDEGAFHPFAGWDGQEPMRLFRERLLARLVEKHAISQDLVATLMSWSHPGFSVHVGDTSESAWSIEKIPSWSNIGCGRSIRAFDLKPSA